MLVTDQQPDDRQAEIVALKARLAELGQDSSGDPPITPPTSAMAQFAAERLMDKSRELEVLNSVLMSKIEKAQRAEEALRAAEERYRTLFHASNDLIFVHWLVHDIFLGEPMEVNDVACQVLGYSRDELLMASTVLISPADDLTVREARKLLQEQGHALFEITLITKDRRSIRSEFNSHLIQLGGQPTVLSVIRDVTRRTHLHEALLSAKMSTDETSRVQREFFSQIANEVRPSLLNLQKMLKLTMETPLTDQQKNYLSQAQNSADQLLTALKAITDFDSSPAGK